MDLSKYRSMFVTEAQEHLRQMNSGIMGLESDPADADRIQGLFRNAHSIKGMAASMGYDAIAGLSHRLEDLMDVYRQGTRRVEAPAIDLLLEGVDALAHHVQAIADETSPEIDLEPLAAKVEGFLRTAAGAARAAAPEAGSRPDRAGYGTAGAAAVSRRQERPGRFLLKVDVQIARGAQSPRVRAFMAHRCLSEMGTVVASVPSTADLRAGTGEFNGRLQAALDTDHPAEAVRRAVAALAEIASVSVESTTGEGTGMAPSPSASSRFPANPGNRASLTAATLRTPRTVKVQTDLLDSFVDMAGELLVVESRLKNVTRDLDVPALKESSTELGKLVRSLHAQIMTVRMTPLSSISDGLARVVRDLARREGKDVAFVQEGTELEVDRSVLEELPDLLTHLLRNAVDHGLEPAAERKAGGKPARGEIRLRAFRQKDRAVIQVEDDGRGMDPARLKAKALEGGRITPEQAARMTDAEALHLCLLPGLSTSREVTEVSGRGVGMDAVRSRVEALGGSIQIDSKPGLGARIALHLPTTVALVQVLLLGLDDEVLAIPVSRVLRTLELSAADIEQRGRQLLFSYGEEEVPLLSLRKILRLPPTETRGRTLQVAVVPVRQRTVGLVVDRFVGQHEAFVKPLPKPLAAIDGVAGVTVLGDGRAIFLLDAENLF